jgi:hypothetical protein
VEDAELEDCPRRARGSIDDRKLRAARGRENQGPCDVSFSFS